MLSQLVCLAKLVDAEGATGRHFPMTPPWTYAGGHGGLAVKLRIRDNTLRVRLTQGEVATLAAGKAVEQTTWFAASQKLSAGIMPSPEAGAVRADFADGVVRVVLPAQLATKWAASEE